MKFHSKSFCELVCTQVTLSGSFIEIESVDFYLQKLPNLEFYFAEIWNFENPNFKKVNWLKMGLFQKLAGSFSIKWEFAKMGLSEVSTARIAKNGIPLYRETPVRICSYDPFSKGSYSPFEILLRGRFRVHSRPS